MNFLNGAYQFVMINQWITTMNSWEKPWYYTTSAYSSGLILNYYIYTDWSFDYGPYPEPNILIYNLYIPIAKYVYEYTAPEYYYNVIKIQDELYQYTPAIRYTKLQYRYNELD